MPKKHNTKLSTRDYQYWITKHCPRAQCWIVIARLEEILSHKNLTLYRNDVPVSITIDKERHKFFVDKAKKLSDTIGDKDNYASALKKIDDHLKSEANKRELNFGKLSYVYSVKMDENCFSALISDDSCKYYVIDNVLKDKCECDSKCECEESESEPKSTIYVIDTLESVYNYIPKNLRIKLGLIKHTKIKLKPIDVKALKSTISVDFIGRSDSEQQLLWKKFVEQSMDILDLSGLLMLENRNMKLDKQYPAIKTIIIYQNNNITKFDWLSHFPNVNTFSIWYSNTVSDDNVSIITQLCPKLESLEFHSCFNVSARSLISICKLSFINKLMFDNPRMRCQENTFSTVIGPKEWSEIENSSLELLMINSDNLTLDFISYIVSSFKVVNRFVIALAVLDKVRKDMHPGYEKANIIFQAFEDTEIGFKINRDIKFTNLLKDKYNDEPFSKSMLEVIKRNNPELI